VHPVVLESGQITQGGQGSFPAEAVQAPEHHQVELLLSGLPQQAMESGALSLAG
jgi:hypothetical protein